MKIYRNIFLFLFAIFFSIGKTHAQAVCQTYACYICQWGGEFKVEVPNVFTPNRDAINDYWLPKVYNQPCLADYHVSIYDRWGKLLFETSVYSVGWNGNEVVAGEPCPEGVYYYILSYKNEYTKEIKSLKGSVQLLR